MAPFIKELILPPGIFILLGLYGVYLIKGNPVRARRILIFVAVLLYILSTKAVAGWLMSSLPRPEVLTEAHLAADAADVTASPGAIVILGAGIYEAAPEYGADTVSGGGLARVRYGARLHRLTGLPILVSGGRPENTALSEAEVMKNALEEDFGVPVKWVEDKSENTRENARASFNILHPEGIEKIYLVTHASHMPRSVETFEHTGFEVVPAATEYWSHPESRARDFLPTAGGLAISRHAIHQWLGRLWYMILA